MKDELTTKKSKGSAPSLNSRFLKSKTFGCSSAGFSSLEILIAMGIIITALSAVIMVAFGNQSVALDNQTNNEALTKANGLLEEAKSSASANFDSLSDASTVTDDIYNKELMITDINSCKKSGVASVSWSTDSREQHIEIETTFANINEAIALGGDCGPDSPPVTEWWFPDTFISVDFSELGGPNSGTSATSIDVFDRGGRKYVVLSSIHSTVTTPDIWIVDVTDIADGSAPYTATLISSINLGFGDGFNDLDYVGSYAFSANNESSKQLHVVDFTNLSVPDGVASESLPGVSSAGSYPQGRKIYYYAERLYIGTNETAGPEFHVFDVSDPANPSHLGSLELTHNIHDIIVRGDFAYLATSDNSGEVMVVDISDPSSMVHPDVTGMKYNAPGDYDGTALYLLSDKLYLGRDGGDLSPYEPNLIVLDVTDLGAMSPLGSRVITKNPSQALGLTAIMVVNDFAFLGTDDSSAEFQVFRVGDLSNIYNCDEDPPQGYSFDPPGCGKYEFPAKITDLEYDDNLIYASVESNDAFRVMFDDPSQY